MRIDDAHDATQRIGRGRVAVNHAERFAVVLPHSHFETMRTGVWIGDGAAHFEATHLPGQHTVLDRHHGARFGDELFELSMIGRHLGRHRMRFGDGGQQRAVVAMPHLNVERELTSATSQQSGGGRCDHVQRVQLMTTRPSECCAETALGLFVDQYEGRVVGGSGGSAGESGRGRERLDTEMVANQRLKSEGEKTGTTIGIVSETGHDESHGIWRGIFTYTVKNPHQNTGVRTSSWRSGRRSAC